MKHKDVKKKLILYLDGELPENEMKEISEHLSTCFECSRQRDLFVSIWNSEDVRQKPVVPPFIWTRLEARIREYEQTSKWNYNLKKAISYVSMHPVSLAASIIAIAVGIFVGTLTFRQQDFGNPSLREKSQIQSSSLTATDEFKLNLFDLVPRNELGSELVDKAETKE